MPFQPSGRPSSSASDWGNILGKGVAGLGEGAARGLQQGLDLLAQNKIQKMQEMQQINKQNQLAELFQKNNYAPEVSEFMSHLYYNNPKAFQQYFPAFNQQEPEPQQDNNMQFDPNALQGLNQVDPNALEGLKNYMRLLSGQGASEQGLSGLSIPQESQKVNQPRKGLLKENSLLNNASLVSSDPYKQERLKAMQIKSTNEEKDRLAALKQKRSSLEDFLDTTEQAIADLENGESSGGNPLYAALTSNQYTSGLAPQKAERAAIIYNKLYNLRTEGLKGLMSKFRLGKLEGDKPGVGRSDEENLRILKSYKKTGEAALADFDKIYPEASIEMPDSIPQQPLQNFSQPSSNNISAKQLQDSLDEVERLFPASKVKEGKQVINNETGEIEFVKKNGKWEHYNG